MKSMVLNCAKVCLLFALTAGTTFGAGYDLIQDGSIDWADVGAFAEKWLADCSVIDCGGANFYHANNMVDLDELYGPIKKLNPFSKDIVFNSLLMFLKF